MCRVYPVEGYYDTRWLTGLWSTQTKMEGKAAWHWGSDSSIVNGLLVEPGHTPLYVGLLSAWGSVDGDRIFSPHFMGEGSFLGTPTDINDFFNILLTVHLSTLIY